MKGGYVRNRAEISRLPMGRGVAQVTFLLGDVCCSQNSHCETCALLGNGGNSANLEAVPSGSKVGFIY